MMIVFGIGGLVNDSQDSKMIDNRIRQFEPRFHVIISEAIEIFWLMITKLSYCNLFKQVVVIMTLISSF
jgi:hypothetical protein